MTLTKAELADQLCKTVGLNKREAKDMVELFFEDIRSALESGDDVKLTGFGNFQLREKSERPGRNPKTGEVAVVTARRVVTFHASGKLKDSVLKGASCKSLKLEIRSHRVRPPGAIFGVSGITLA